MDSNESGFHEIEVTINNRQGLHARPASQFVNIASRFPGVQLHVEKDTVVVDGKSMIGMMMLAAGPGTRLKLRASGEGSLECLTKLAKLVEDKFNEQEAPDN